MNDEMNNEKEQQEKKPAPSKKKVRKVPKKSGITVSSGKTKKKLVNSSLKQTDHTSEEELKKAEAAAAEEGNQKVQNKSARSVLENVRQIGRRLKADRQTENRPERDLTTSSHTAKRIDRERQKRRKERLEARKAEIAKQRIMIGGGVAAVLLLMVLLAACPGGNNSTGSVESTTADAQTAAENTEETLQEGYVSVSSQEVRHFSFRMLLADEMAVDDTIITVSQFRQILQQLYDSNYILVDFYSIAGIQEAEDGSITYTNTTLQIPEGKIPFVLSQRDLSYSLDRVGKGYPTRLILTEDGQLTDEYQTADGTITQGSYDVITILEEFIAEHPDFSHENARGVLGLTGYNGILGYRTSSYLALSAEEGNQYAVYGTFDVDAEREAAKPVVEALREKGWHFASYGNSYVSYGSEYELMVSDMEQWQTNVASLVDGINILMYPCETDIAAWSAYQEDNQKYQYLKSLGFDYYCIEEVMNPSWLQIRSGYVRQGMKEIDSYEYFTQLMAES